MKLNIPISLTLFRFFLIPFFVISYYIDYSWSAAVTTIIFIVASATDWLDGYLARRLNQTTQFGAFLDPVADKVLVTIAFVLIAEHFHSWWVTIPVSIMIAREIIISALREWMAELGERNSVKVSWAGKLKTSLQMICLTALLWRSGLTLTSIGVIALYTSTALTIYSMYGYLRAAKKHL
ncbi:MULTISPECIES: CDP-diacylglycerol--glycerol-3-phosphate 3-phosphatidyltransferase [unclassified Pantoea]|uniref:CDP-diacylglycerol--glycerol-3-phosphate 3-phosphatidyltransferase n=1 Tax=unclassified Pantoea TaxID=2630326 RepID=UPI001CD2D9A7|nr:MULTISPECIES: CDP-diacylglycerol--glycerol-3-phosphate 3-phosphatidyltransferase [unclassified Pantoea]MCA1176231.1 CDP-diacylglycerol--glycerol-3-phosphate 3-phosphatidyltransferase [Pantoea sp. alder69]MCA1249201.1 CDP-diacylglycerol--glycerol-3-phosphate 3-phosphatidyltransferase [Pantoea sp. alder70]MCA1264724.1 CDP-diacylglycerol--glycerol-3-phosphate 3-phosphatidyltransferase [Pantoea sp. alder81]